MSKIRILLVDDHAMIRSGVQKAINGQPDMEVIAQASNGQEAIALAQAHQPDLIVMDISLPDLGGAEATKAICEKMPEARVLVFTGHGDPGYLRSLLQAGATGYLLKNAASQELINAIRVVAAGVVYVDPSLSDNVGTRVMGRFPAKANVQSVQSELTNREREVLRLIAWGRSNKGIAAQFEISVKSVEYYKAQATAKLDLFSRMDIVRYAISQGWLHADQEPK